MRAFGIKKSYLKAQKEQGSVLLETAITLPLFFVLIFFSIDLLRLAYYSTTTHFLATRVVREATIGVSTEDNLNSHKVGDILNRIAELADIYLLANKNLSVELPNGSCNLSTRVCTGLSLNSNVGKGGEIINVTLSSTLSIFFGLVETTVSGSAIGRNEFF